MGWGLLFWGAVVAVTAALMVYVHVTDWRKAGPCSACRAVSLLPLSVFVVGVPVHLAAGVLGVSWWARWPVAFAVLFPLIVFQSRLRRWLHRTDTRPQHLARVGASAKEHVKAFDAQRDDVLRAIGETNRRLLTLLRERGHGENT